MFVCVFEIQVCFYLVVSVPENYNSLSANCVRAPFVQTSYKLKILVSGNIINQWGQPQKGGGGTKFLKFSGGSKSGGGTIFDLNLVGGKPWRKL